MSVINFSLHVAAAFVGTGIAIAVAALIADHQERARRRRKLAVDHLIWVDPPGNHRVRHPRTAMPVIDRDEHTRPTVRQAPIDPHAMTRTGKDVP